MLITAYSASASALSEKFLKDGEGHHHIVTVSWQQITLLHGFLFHFISEGPSLPLMLCSNMAASVVECWNLKKRSSSDRPLATDGRLRRLVQKEQKISEFMIYVLTLWCCMASYLQPMAPTGILNALLRKPPPLHLSHLSCDQEIATSTSNEEEVVRIWRRWGVVLARLLRRSLP